MADNSFRVLLDFGELNLKSLKYVWMSISPRDLKTIKDLKIAILKKFTFDKGDIQLFLQDGLLPEDENVVVLRENDVIRLQYTALLDSASGNSSITSSLIPASVPHVSEEIDYNKEKYSKKRKKKSLVSSPNIVEKDNNPEKRVESSKKKRRHLSFETLTENATSRNSSMINPVDKNVGINNINYADSSKLKNDNHLNCKKKKKHKRSHSDIQNDSFTINENEIIFSDEIITIQDDESLKFIDSKETKKQRVVKEEFGMISENSKSSEVVLCPTSVSDTNFAECENTNIPTVDLEINSENKATTHDYKNKTVTSNSECMVTNTSSPMQGNNCKKKKRKRHRKRKSMLTDSPFNDSTFFGSDLTVTEKSKNLDDSFHISSQHKNDSSTEEIATTGKVPYLFSSGHCTEETSDNLILSTPPVTSQNSSIKVLYDELCKRNKVFKTPSWISNVTKPYLLSPPRYNYSATRNEASFSSGSLHLGTASKLSPTKISCKTENPSSPSVCENNFSSSRSIKSPIQNYLGGKLPLETTNKPSPSKNSYVTKNTSLAGVYEDDTSSFRSIKSPKQTDYSGGKLHVETTNKPSPSKNSCVTKNTSPADVHEDNSSPYRTINSPIKTDYSSESRHLISESKVSGSIFVTETSTPMQQTVYSRIHHFETAGKPSTIINSSETKNASHPNASKNNSSSLRSFKSPMQTDFSSRSRHNETAKPSSVESDCVIIKTSTSNVIGNNSSSFRNNKFQTKIDYVNSKVETTSTKVSHSAPLNSFPAAGTRIAYKILELDETYSPVVSDYKEGIVTKVFPETDELEIELIKPEVKFGRIGKFENIYDEDEPPPTEVIQTVHLSWSSLIDPIRRNV